MFIDRRKLQQQLRINFSVGSLQYYNYFKTNSVLDFHIVMFTFDDKVKMFAQLTAGVKLVWHIKARIMLLTPKTNIYFLHLHTNGHYRLFITQNSVGVRFQQK